MHDAYETLPVLERLPLMIESIACYGEYFELVLILIFTVILCFFQVRFYSISLLLLQKKMSSIKSHKE